MNIQYGVRRRSHPDGRPEDIEATDCADAEKLIRAITEAGEDAFMPVLITRPVGEWTEAS